MAATAALVIVFSIAPAVLDTGSLWERERELVTQTEPLLRQYEELRERFPETPIPSSQMELVVARHDNILDQILQPQKVLASISEALTASPRLTLTRFGWDLVEVVSDDVAEVYAGPIEASDAEIFQKAVVTGRTEMVVTVAGVVESNESHREAREQVLAFSGALDKFEDIGVTPGILPMEASPDTAVTTSLDGKTVRETFVLELRQEEAP